MILFLVSLFLASNAQAGDIKFVQVKNPCTDKEAFQFSDAVPKAWRERLGETSKDSTSAFLSLASAQVLKTAAKDPAYQAMAEFKIGDALYRMGLPHLAFERFNNLFAATTPYARNLKIASLKCLAVLQDKVPSLVLLPQSVQLLQVNPIAQLSDDDKAILYSQVTAFAERQLSSSANPDLGAAYFVLLNSGPYEAYVQTLQSAKGSNPYGTIDKAEAFLKWDEKGEGLPAFLKGRADTTRILLGQLYYEDGKYSDSARAFRSVTNESNYLAQALTDLAWSNLLDKSNENHYNDALGAARNLLMGSLKRTFAPEADVVTAIGLIETCHFAETLQAIKHFNKQYWVTYNWLYQWRKNYPAQADIYHVLMRQMKKQEKVPVRIATEWTRSPVFLQNQEEINVTYDERDVIKGLIPKLLSYQKSHRKLQLDEFVTRMNREVEEGKTREKVLIANINIDLINRSQAMLMAVADAWDNSQLIEVETYNKVGDKMMADNFAAKRKEIANNRAKNKDTAPVWDWGRVPAADDDSAEVWEDEVGFLQADMKDQCTRK